MPSALIIFASLTGNTEEIARLTQKALQKLGVQVSVRECTQAYVSEFKTVDICVVATYTYGSEGDLPYEIEDFYFDLESLDLRGKVFGVLGSGEKFYDYYCKSVDDFDRQFVKTGAERGASPLKIELKASKQDILCIEQFAQNLVNMYLQKNYR